MTEHEQAFPEDPQLQPLEDLLRARPKPAVPPDLARRIDAATAEPFFAAQLNADLANLDRMLRSRQDDPTAPADLARRIYYATVEHLQQEQLESELRPLDARLREALRCQPPAHLADRVFEKTLYQLSSHSPPPSRTVLARLRLERVIWYSAMAAAWAFALGAAVWFQTLSNTTPHPSELARGVRPPIPQEAKKLAASIAEHKDVVETPLVVE
ncbi:MAG: hypothetical protein R3236_11185, partial [Phycisphaeraceae bacterium]|nr:hypothetical protein [Phycisphaeraceae bacterium]